MATRDVSTAQEKRIAKAIGAKRTPNSGATKFDKRGFDYWSRVVVGS